MKRERNVLSVGRGKRVPYKYIVTLLLIFGVLTGMRWGWAQLFAVKDQPRAVDGVLDLRGTDLEKSPAFYLNGEWKFYPGALITQDEIHRVEPNSRTIQVPGDWGSALHPDSGSSYGYGTYRLRILTDPLKSPVSFWFKGIQSSSAVEINGEMAGSIGKIAVSEREYVPESVSYTASRDAEGATEIELSVRISNFDSPYHGGIVSPIRFGSQAAIDYLRWYSIGFQLFTFLVLVLHGLYACILYMLNRQEKALLILALLLLAISIAILVVHDTVLLLWLPINYTWAVKIRLISLLWQNLLIIMLFKKFAPSYIQGGKLRAYIAASVVLTVVLLAVPASTVFGIIHFHIFDAYYYLSFAWFVYLSGKMIFKRQPDSDSIFLLVTSAGIISNILWSLAEAAWDVTTVYYPIDIVVAITGYCSYWFKKYFQKSRENAELNEKLTKADHIKDQFLVNTSHELRTPLHGIMNIAHNVVTKEKDTLEKDSLDDMQLLITISRRMSYLLGDLLDVVRLKEKRIVLQQEPLKIQSVVPGIIAMLQYMVETKPISLKVEIPESLPPVMADEKRLVQVLYNLLHNALKYTETGTISVSAEIRVERVDIQIADTGIGMDEATQARIFIPYEQGAQGISNGQGIGLGLSISKELVELHGGTLTVHSEPGKGSVFCFDLPLANEPSLSMPQAPLYTEMSIDEADGEHVRSLLPDVTTAEQEVSATALPPLLDESRARILAVDDDPINLKVLVGMLSSEPYDIVTAQSGQEALELLGSQPWDLLIADVMMPNMSGYELTRSVREQFPMSELPVLLLTARSQPADIYTGFQAGASDYVTKPVDALELKYRIRALVTLRQSINERLRMEAAYLQAQIQPHFLLNTLNSLMAVSEVDTENMRRLGEAFASYLEISFNYLNRGELVDLSHELELVKAYLYIEQVRFGDRLSMEWEVEPDIRLQLPPLSIQPLVENAVKHGLLSSIKGGTVRLAITRQNGYSLIEITDNGKGMDQEQVARVLNSTLSRKGGIGIANTNRRLRQLYGRGLSIASKLGEGTTVSFVIPDRERMEESG
ncbi:ATP-binding response regulator [Paenibacillus tuaregi]|uniref:ATP-binding response regulator n=1 Tax=Paenibacillus tuaregi TaxID=1816681 RepID=UPI000837C5F3|nr:ATP-binding protein [Paenibacillus tuaregi]